MIMLHSCLCFSAKYHPLQLSGCVKKHVTPITRIHEGAVNRGSESTKYSIRCRSSLFHLSNCRNRNGEGITNDKQCKPFNRHRAPVTLQDEAASRFDEDNNNSIGFRDAFLKNINAIFQFTRPFFLLGVTIDMTSVSLLAPQQFADLTPTFFIGLLKAIVPGLLVNIYEVGVNQLYDVEIDKINKPDLPLASGDLSIGAGITITCTCLLMSLAIGIMLRSPPLISTIIMWFVLSSAYSVDLPFLRWKRNPFLATMYGVLERGLAMPLGYFMHIQKYVLGRPIEFSRTLMFVVAVKCWFCVLLVLLKDMPDVDGDKEHGIQTLSIALGKEKVLWLGVYMLLVVYGALVIAGASSPFLESKLITIIGHSTLAFLLLQRARNVDVSSQAAILSFYRFIWKLLFAEHILLPCVRL
ncbi:homogentisate geranylgeranyltransferase [Citrus sinensis]|nr:homogentisate geranylgeranyltransferase [Citrus sinensis]